MYREPLTVIVPCLNEEEVIELTIAEIYSELNLIKKNSFLIINVFETHTNYFISTSWNFFTAKIRLNRQFSMASIYHY